MLQHCLAEAAVAVVCVCVCVCVRRIATAQLIYVVRHYITLSVSSI